MDSEIRNLEYIFEILNDFNKKLFNYKVVDYINKYNFHIDHVNIRDFLLILNFKFQISKYVNLQPYFGTLNNFNSKTFQLQIVDPVEGYNFFYKVCIYPGSFGPG